MWGVFFRPTTTKQQQPNKLYVPVEASHRRRIISKEGSYPQQALYHGQELECAAPRRTRGGGTALASTTIVPQAATATATTTTTADQDHQDDDDSAFLLLPTVLEGILSLLLLHGGLVSGVGRPLGHHSVSVILVQQRRLRLHRLVRWLCAQ
jgi:hypothetical protein